MHPLSRHARRVEPFLSLLKRLIRLANGITSVVSTYPDSSDNQGSVLRARSFAWR
jgi:hypothetical protein